MLLGAGHFFLYEGLIFASDEQSIDNIPTVFVDLHQISDMFFNIIFSRFKTYLVLLSPFSYH